ncbi:sterol desaturase family protein [Microbulbifer sp. SSSA008]|uniref:sterol desaturase family protein n=1 Tax=Microbulbifer sp. SSSA008 TaxID=3243380 RepID=UPI00403A00D0
MTVSDGEAKLMFEVLEVSAEALAEALTNLLLPAVIFFLFSLLVKGRAAFEAIKGCFSENIQNLFWLTLNTVLVTPLLILLYRWVNLSGVTLDYMEMLWGSIPGYIVVFCAVFCGDFIGYWRHRLEHTRFLWPGHLIHHSDRKMSWLTLERFHPVNRLSTFFIDSSLLLFLGFPPYAVIANSLIRHYYGFFIHADLPWTYGRWGKIFVSPVMHRWHHAEEKAAHHTNFASIFSVFDQWFGTYRVPGLCNKPLGVSNRVGASLIGQLCYPFKVEAYRKRSD